MGDRSEREARVDFWDNVYGQLAVVSLLEWGVSSLITHSFIIPASKVLRWGV